MQIDNYRLLNDEYIFYRNMAQKLQKENRELKEELNLIRNRFKKICADSRTLINARVVNFAAAAERGE